MSIQWADDFSRYGLGSGSRTAMLDGLPYATIGFIVGGDVVIDPDPNASGSTRAFQIGVNGNSWSTDFRVALPVVVSGTVGVAFRSWLESLPVDESGRPAIVGVQKGNGVYLVYARVEQNGSIVVTGQVAGVLTEVADSVNPIIRPNSWNHWEMVYNVAGGSGAIHINGIERLTFSGLDTLDNAELVNFSARSDSGIGAGAFIKDLVIWDSNGSENNSLMGTVVVRRLLPNGNNTLGDWAKNFPTVDADNILSNKIPFNTLTFTSSPPSTASNLRIGEVYYRFTTGSADTGSPAGTSVNPWLIRRGTSANENAQIVHNAVNASGVAGTDYSTALEAHPLITSTGVSANITGFSPIDGVSVDFTFASPFGASWLSIPAMLESSAPNDFNYISAGLPPVAPAIFDLEDLPPDVTSVRALISVVRTRKIDGGDANLQNALSPDGVAWDNGQDRPLTSAFSYDFDVSEIDPSTSAQWTPAKTDLVQIRINRTV